MATIEEIGRFITQCCQYFEHKEPKPETINLWHEELSDLDASYFPDMLHKFAKVDGWPKNFPMKVREIYGAVKKADGGWSIKNIVESYYRDHYEEINHDAYRSGVDPMDMAWAEMSRPLVRKGNITKAQGILYWNRAKKGPLPDYLKGPEGDHKDRERIYRFGNEFGVIPRKRLAAPLTRSWPEQG